MTVATSQRRTYLQFAETLRPYWRNDRALPERMRRLLGSDRRLGSRDRRLYRELLYTTLRFLPWIEPLLDTDPERAAAVTAWLAADTPDTRAYREGLLGSWPALPEEFSAVAAFLGEEISTLLPDWCARELPGAFAAEDLTALQRRAPLWLRLAGDDFTEVSAELASMGLEIERSAVLPGALQVRGPRPTGETDLSRSPAFSRGSFEVQDLGSQLVLETVGVAPGESWLDACAGAGGKSLQLAGLLGEDGHVDAYDVRADALEELGKRAARARLGNVDILGAARDSLDSAKRYDGVLVDAPCSGSGTWRRAPHLRWTTTPADLDQYASVQAKLLTELAACVRPGGVLVYATCSLCRTENESVVRAFLAEAPDFEVRPPARDFGYPQTGSGLWILPARYDTDGFFVASLVRRS